MKISLMALSLSTGMATEMSPLPSTSPLQDLSIQGSQPKVKDVKTKTGLRVWLVENQDIPVLSLSICFKNAGSQADPEGKKGLSTFLSNLLDKGCGDYDATAFKEHLLSYNIRLSIDTSKDDLILSFQVPKSSIREAFRVVTLILTHPRFTPDMMDRTKNQILTVLKQSLHSETAMASDLMNQRAFPNHPYGKSIRQSIQDLPTLTRQDLVNFMTHFLTKDRLVLTASGAISPTELCDLLDETFKDLPEKGEELSLSQKDPVTSGGVFYEKMDVPQSAIVFFQKGVNRQDPDFYAATVLMKILGDGPFDSRLWQEVREKRGLAYGINASLYWNRYSAYIAGSTATQKESVEKVITLIKTQWKEMKEKGITEQELTFTKEKMIGSYPLAFGSTYKIVSLLQGYQLDGLDPDFINQRNTAIQKVTLEDINRVAKRLTPETLSFIVVGQTPPATKGNAQ